MWWKALFHGGVIFLVALFSYELCSHKSDGTVESYEMAKEECWLWCGARVIIDGQLKFTEPNIWYVDSSDGQFELPTLQYSSTCKDQSVSVHGVVRQTPFLGGPKFSEVENVAAVDPNTGLLIRHCLPASLPR